MLNNQFFKVSRNSRHEIDNTYYFYRDGIQVMRFSLYGKPGNLHTCFHAGTDLTPENLKEIYSGACVTITEGDFYGALYSAAKIKKDFCELVRL